MFAYDFQKSSKGNLYIRNKEIFSTKYFQTRVARHGTIARAAHEPYRASHLACALIFRRYRLFFDK